MNQKVMPAGEQGFLTPLIAIIIIIAAGISGWVLFQNQKVKSVPPALVPQATNQDLPENQIPTPSPAEASVPADWKTYRNEKYGFEVKYPEGWHLKFETPNIEFTNSKGYVHGLGIPSFGEMSFTIVPAIKSRGLTCRATDTYSTDAEWPGLWPMEKNVCLGDVRIILEYTDDYQQPLPAFQVEENKKLFEDILSTFRFIPSTSSGQTK